MMNMGVSEHSAVPSDALDRAFFPIADRLRDTKKSHRDGFQFLRGIPVADHTVLAVDCKYGLNHGLPQKTAWVELYLRREQMRAIRQGLLLKLERGFGPETVLECKIERPTLWRTRKSGL